MKKAENNVSRGRVLEHSLFELKSQTVYVYSERLRVSYACNVYIINK